MPKPTTSSAIILIDADRPDEAEAAYRKAIALRPDHAESHCDLGMALWKQGKLAPALASLERGHELGSRARTGTIRRPSGCENAERSSSRLAGRDKALPRGADLTPWRCSRR